MTTSAPHTTVRSDLPGNSENFDETDELFFISHTYY